jgi:cytochrome c biogenesis protein CcdA
MSYTIIGLIDFITPIVIALVPALYLTIIADIQNKKEVSNK